MSLVQGWVTWWDVETVSPSCRFVLCMHVAMCVRDDTSMQVRHVPTETSDSEVVLPYMAGWRCASTMCGARCAMILGMLLMLKLFADSWVSSLQVQCWCTHVVLCILIRVEIWKYSCANQSVPKCFAVTNDCDTVDWKSGGGSSPTPDDSGCEQEVHVVMLPLPHVRIR